jgi:hypothetical protein
MHLPSDLVEEDDETAVMTASADTVHENNMLPTGTILEKSTWGHTYANDLRPPRGRAPNAARNGSNNWRRGGVASYH